MREKAKEVHKIFCTINPISKVILKLGISLSVMLLCAGAVCSLLAAGSAEGWKLLDLSAQLASASPGCLLAALIPGLIGDVILKRDGYFPT